MHAMITRALQQRAQAPSPCTPAMSPCTPSMPMHPRLIIPNSGPDSRHAPTQDAGDIWSQALQEEEPRRELFGDTISAFNERNVAWGAKCGEPAKAVPGSSAAPKAEFGDLLMDFHQKNPIVGLNTKP